MKKIFVLLLGVAATVNAVAVEYTARAILTLKSASNYECKVVLRQSDEYGELDGYEMNMDDRHIALYALKGTMPLEVAMANNLEDVKLGLKTDASTSYTITVSSVAGNETLYLLDGADKAFALTEGAVIEFEAAANATDEARFVISKQAPAPAEPSICFNYNILEIKGYEGKSLVIKQGADEIENVEELPADYQKDLSDKQGRLVVTLDGQDYQIDANPAVTPAN